MGYKESSPKRSDYSPSSHTEKPKRAGGSTTVRAHAALTQTAPTPDSSRLLTTPAPGDLTLSPGFCQHCTEMIKMRAEVK